MGGRSVRAAASLALLAALAGCGDDEPGTGPDKVVRSYLDARIEGDCDEAEDRATDDAELAPCREPDEVVGSGPEVGEASVDGEKATVEVTDYFACFNGDPVDFVETYHLVVESGEWLIDEVEYAYPNDDDCISQNE